MEESQEGRIAHTLALIVVVLLLVLAAKGVASLADDPPTWASQTGAVVVAVAPPAPAAASTVTDNPDPATVYCEPNNRPETVSYACAQSGKIDEVESLNQSGCKENGLGFEYTITVSKNIVSVKPTSLKPSSSGCPIPPTRTCKSGGQALKSFSKECKVKYCVNAPVGIQNSGGPILKSGCFDVENPSSKSVSDIANDPKNQAGAAKALVENLDLSDAKQVGEAQSALQDPGLSSALNQALSEKKDALPVEIEKTKVAEDKLNEYLKTCTAVCNVAENNLEQLKIQREEMEKQLAGLAAAKVSQVPKQEPTGEKKEDSSNKPPPNTGNNPSPSTFQPPPTNQGASNQSGLGQMLQSLMQGLSGGQQPPAGNQAAQPEGTCSQQLTCSGNTLYSRNNQCVDTTIQNCQYGCLNKTACATTPKQPTPPGQPTAQLSCQPLVADVGMTLAISWGCSVGKSVGSGFSTNGKISGSATTTIATPPMGARTANFGLTCTNEGISSNTSCTVQVAKPAIVLVANPKSVELGETANIGWVTASMKENGCVISSPNQPDFTEQNANNPRNSGVAETLPITTETTFLLTCITAGGNTREATTTVMVK